MHAYLLDGIYLIGFVKHWHGERSQHSKTLKSDKTKIVTT